MDLATGTEVIVAVKTKKWYDEAIVYNKLSIILFKLLLQVTADMGMDTDTGTVDMGMGMEVSLMQLSRN